MLSCDQPLLLTQRVLVSPGVGAAIDAGITKRAKKEEWPRDLPAKVKAKADALVSKQTVSSEVSIQAGGNRKAGRDRKSVV